jgi:dihydrofolate synthase/folylpolyglutamate synthase
MNLQMKMSYGSALNRLYKLNRFHRFKYDLDAVRKLSAFYGNPHKDLDIIHVTGTNGKGSVTFKLAKILEDNGLKTGLFISPHLTTFRERIQVNGNYIEKEYVADFLNSFFQEMDEGRVSGSFFEVLTVMAFKYFRDMQSDVVCLEVGIGGKMDATNIIDRNLLAIITAIGLDHCNLLGDTKEEITIQKCGIIKNRCHTLIGPSVPIKVVQTICKRMNSQMHECDPQSKDTPFWKVNESIVCKAVEVLNLKRDKKLEIRQEIIERNLPGRRENVPTHLVEGVAMSKNVPDFVITDVGHNEMAVGALLESFRLGDPDKDLIVVYGTSGLKDSLSSLKTISKYASTIMLVQGQNNRAKPIELLAEDAASLKLPCLTIENGLISKSLEYLFRSVDLKNKGVIICGSFFIMEEVREFFKFPDEKDELFLNEYNSL